MSLNPTSIPVVNAGGTSPTLQNGSLIDTGTLSSPGDVYTDTWVDFGIAGHFTGFSGTPTGSIYTKRVGKTVFVNISITGTSNASVITVTLPYAAGAGNWINVAGEGVTNATYAPALIQISGSTVTLYPNTTGGGGNWTNGTSSYYGQFWYQSV